VPRWNASAFIVKHAFLWQRFFVTIQYLCFFASRGRFISGMPTVLTILAEGFEELEAVAPVDLLRRAGAEVTTAALGDGIHVTGRSGLTLHADATLATVGEKAFDLLFLPGGAGVRPLRADPRVRAIVVRHHDAGRWLAAICAAPVILQDAGLLAGRRFTAHFSVAAELPGILAGERTVADGRLLTGRGAGTATEFGLLLVEKLFSLEKSREIAASICAV
jgi:4-methyl-5(b-hydroxyethyl)-thiazole monophosphate biosynthesis